MAGQGPAPKQTGRKVGHSKAQGMTTIEFVRGEQPELPENINWPERTQQWWAMWAESPLSATFGQTDWDFLLDTAILHAAYWSGDLSAAAELRIRVAKFGATPEDRARLRIQFAEADERDTRNAGRTPKGEDGPKSARERYGNVTTADFGSKQTG
jgi:hypothetical protein